MADRLDKSDMTPEHVLHWLIDFGSDWVSDVVLSATWADNDLFWHGCVKYGWLEHKATSSLHGRPEYYKLTPQALALVKEVDHAPA